MHALDVLRAAWIFVVFLFIFFWIPGRLFSQEGAAPLLIRLAGHWIRMVLVAGALVLLLVSAKIFTAITVILLLLIALGIAWLRSHGWEAGALIANVQGRTLKLLRRAEGWSFGRYLLPRSRQQGISINLPPWMNLHRWLEAIQGRELKVALFLVVLAISNVLLFEHAFRELRYDQAEQYSALLRARELVLNLRGLAKPFLFPALAATTSLVSATMLIEVVRFLFPLVSLFLVLATGLTLRTCTRSGLAGILAMYCLGAAAFPVAKEVTPVAATTGQKLLALLDYSPALTRPSAEFQLGIVFMLLGLTFLADWHRHGRWDSLIDVLCCAVLAGVVSQFLLIGLLLGGAASLVIGPTLGLVALVVASYGLAAFSVLSSGIGLPNEVFTILPVAAAIGVGCLVMLIHGLVSMALGKRADAIVLAAFALIALVWLRPHGFVGQFLEYEVAARKTQEIRQNFPPQRWAVVAPVEQLAGTFGFGGFEDLASFVDKYRGQVANPDFEFPDAPDDLFIYVEKNPFQMFVREPASVSFAVLTDATYRNYRSPAGRASLQSAALEFCENYRRSHTNSVVLFEDQNLRIYHIRPKPDPNRIKK